MKSTYNKLDEASVWLILRKLYEEILGFTEIKKKNPEICLKTYIE